MRRYTAILAAPQFLTIVCASIACSDNADSNLSAWLKYHEVRSELFCAGIETCCGVFDIGPDGMACEQFFERSKELTIPKLEKGTLRFHSGATECALEELNDRLDTCNLSLQDPDEQATSECGDVIVPGSAEGQPCDDAPVDCEQIFNHTPVCHDDKCLQLRHGVVEDACDGDFRSRLGVTHKTICRRADGLFCNDQRKCHPFLEPGDVGCQSAGLLCSPERAYCSNDKCIAKREPPGVCVISRDCVPTAFCNAEGQCTADGESGAPCDDAEQCVDGACVNDTCVPWWGTLCL